jgi:hypothetical protein
MITDKLQKIEDAMKLNALLRMLVIAIIMLSFIIPIWFSTLLFCKVEATSIITYLTLWIFFKGYERVKDEMTAPENQTPK